MVAVEVEVLIYSWLCGTQLHAKSARSSNVPLMCHHIFNTVPRVVSGIRLLEGFKGGHLLTLWLLKYNKSCIICNVKECNNLYLDRALNAQTLHHFSFVIPWWMLLCQH